MDPTTKPSKKNFGFYVTYAINLIAVITPVVLLLLPIDFFDKGESICLSKVIFDLECYACGMTRGIMHLIHFDFSGAWAFNKLSFIVLPLLFPIWLKAVYFVIRKPAPQLLRKMV